MLNLAPLREFIVATTRLVDTTADEAGLLHGIRPLLEQLITTDNWLPEELTRPHPQYYQQYLLHADPRERWSMVSFVWGPGQKTPVHDHRVWGLVGVLQGAEVGPPSERGAHRRRRATGDQRLEHRHVVAVSPTIGDIHQVANAFDDRVSISIHVYGGNIGAVRRAVYDADTGVEKPFVSGYSNAFIPNVWDRSAEVRASLAQS